jgi:hypothetical protein
MKSGRGGAHAVEASGGFFSSLLVGDYAARHDGKRRQVTHNMGVERTSPAFDLDRTRDVIELELAAAGRVVRGRVADEVAGAERRGFDLDAGLGNRCHIGGQDLLDLVGVPSRPRCCDLTDTAVQCVGGLGAPPASAWERR